jgi:hypothetical protein
MNRSMPALRLADVFEAGCGALMAQYGARLQSHQQRAIAAIMACRSGALGALDWHCPDCAGSRETLRSCGHRSCPACQNHSTTAWLERQRAKLLPVDYFMITFTLPAGLRGLAHAQPHAVYAALFEAAAGTVKGFGAHQLKAELGQCAVLHTHNRRLDLHPHVHVVVPGGGIDVARRQWRKVQGRYLFNAFALAKVFRAKLLRALSEAGLCIPVGLPPKWVVDCRNVGSGEPALEYLSRYLYRGVLRERDLVEYDAVVGTVTFRYRDSQTQKAAYRTLPIADFLWKVLCHVLPSGFRRVRDYGFLHGKASKRLALVQIVLRVIIEPRTPRPRPGVCCPVCQSPMRIVAVRIGRRPDS